MRKKLTIYPERIAGTPNPKMWGIFYEEINHAGDGGIYGELLRNRSFADSKIPEGTAYADGKVVTPGRHVENFDISDPLPGWKLFLKEGAIAMMDLSVDAPRNPKCPEQMRLSIMKPGKGIRVINEGFWGIPVKKQNYYGFLILRGEGITKVDIGFMHSNGIEYVRETIAVEEAFQKVSYAMDCPVEDENARFFLEVKEAGILYIDFVTMFPEDTYQNKPYGFRKDLVEKLIELKPGFLRFPGGCVVEGITLENAIHWKETRGPIEDRPGHWDLWNYRATDGLGMLEFCQLAEYLDADLMYVVNCGLACQCRNNRLSCNQARKGLFADGEDLEFWLQNALDGIEYIYGDVSTPYGALRAADGHPEPFSLKYVEIGNENSGEEYYSRYKVFYKAIKEKYPELTLLADSRVPDAPMDMVDDHYYEKPQQFPVWHEVYEKEGIPLYIGEYGCIEEVGYGNLLGAISEASFMVRMENLCDRIRIASYAPLFCRDEDRNWKVNLINFDGTRIFGIPSFEVQKMFSAYTVDHVCETSGEYLPYNTGGIHATAGVKDGQYITKLVNFGPETIDVEIHVEGKAITTEKTWLLASGDEHDTNSLLKPKKVAVMEAVAEQEEDHIIMSMPPYSFAVVTGV